MFGIMRELSMFYKMKNTSLLAVALMLAFVSYDTKAQGLVSLSEEAMFDDELESNRDFSASSQKSEETPKDDEEKREELPSLEVPSAAEKAPLATPKDEVLPPAPTPTPAPVIAPTPAPVEPAKETEVDNDVLLSGEAFSGDLFSKMSDLERKTTLMNLELRRERLQNEIEAVKNQRRQAMQQEKEKEEAARLKALEKEKEIEKKLLEEQQKLRELDIKFETLRQEKLLGAYKNKMLEETQKWIEHDGVFYKQIGDLRQERRNFATEIKDKMEAIKKEAVLAHGTYISRLEAMKKEKEDMQQQINILKDRIVFIEKQREEEAAAAAAAAAARRNPFAEGEEDLSEGGSISGSLAASTSDAEPSETELSQLYAVTEIRGKGNELVAKLINKNGTSFFVKRGTVLQSGHIIKEITATYVMAERLGQNDYLYFAAGGVLPSETTDFIVEKSE